MAKKTGGGRGSKKYGREKRKAIAKGNPCSAFVRGRISAAEYWKLSGITTPHARG